MQYFVDQLPLRANLMRLAKDRGGVLYQSQFGRYHSIDGWRLYVTLFFFFCCVEIVLNSLLWGTRRIPSDSQISKGKISWV